ncbi:hypothetical protein HJC23_009644 [Cyclotella cryptica]|uniref:Uncharacterized protein n=1 Tax=Cyclotella cryptica TaxID=29204 RepID=A0ABD3Q1N0_9STRA
MISLKTIVLLALTPLAASFITPSHRGVTIGSIGESPITRRSIAQRSSTQRNMAEDKAAKQVTGAELEKMLQEWDTPLVVDAYATW